MQLRKINLGCTLFFVFGAACDGGEGLVQVTPALRAEPLTLEFGPVEEGTLRTLRVTLASAADVPIRVEPPVFTADSDPRFAFQRTFRGSIAIAPGASEELLVRFSAETPGEASGILRITSDDPRAPLDLPLNAETIANRAPALIACVDGACGADVSFDTTAPAGEARSAQIVLKNEGSRAVSIASARASEDASPAIVFTPAELQGELAPGASRAIEVSLTAPSFGTERARFEVLSDDPRHPQVVASLSIATALPAFCLRPDHLSFPIAIPASEVSARLELVNCGAEAVEILGLEVVESADRFRVERIDPNAPAIVEPESRGGAPLAIRGRYRRDTEGNDRGVLRVRTSLGDHGVTLEASAVDPRCSLPSIIEEGERMCGPRVEVHVSAAGRDDGAGTAEDPVQTIDRAAALCGPPEGRGMRTCHIRATTGDYQTGTREFRECLIIEGGYSAENGRWEKSDRPEDRARIHFASDALNTEEKQRLREELTAIYGPAPVSYDVERWLVHDAPNAYFVLAGVNFDSDAGGIHAPSFLLGFGDRRVAVLDTRVDAPRGPFDAGGQPRVCRSELYAADTGVGIILAGLSIVSSSTLSTTQRIVLGMVGGGSIMGSKFRGTSTFYSVDEVAIRDSEFVAEESAIDFFSPAGVLISGSRITSSAHGISMSTAADVIIRNNVIDAPGQAICVDGCCPFLEATCYPEDRSEQVLIEDNTIIGGTLPTADAARNIVVTGNEIR